ncbi:serine hydrolase domain-containing protein [Poritiphilus flavus]|uniref:Serine hydrolase n=1 Tax=Poritiphilus flavus TaxID=2697053 RepID=A0A6L9E7I1_9FLAO|nr:serine hydrolase [Poritiphilus flavus]NAS10696.1 serine hydrolase [Poritiphilus flavus]
MKSFYQTFGFYLFLLLLSLKTAVAQSKDYYPDEKWRVSAPEAQGINSKKINDFISLLRAGRIQKPITSFAIVKNGYLVVDETFGNYNGNTPHTLQSVTKSITATLVGVAIEQGFIQSTEQKIISFFPEYSSIANMDNHKRDLDLEDALTMRTGQAWTGESHLDALNRYPGDRMKYVLDYKMETSPGKKWYYNSGIAILLGGLLQNASGMYTQEFAQKYLFDPMQISSANWRWSHRGIPHTGGGLFLKPKDMAKIGYLYLRNGNWKGKQLLPEWWVKKATTRHVTYTEDIAGISQLSYGYMWWLMSLDKKARNQVSTEIFMAYGHWGQFIFIIPRYDMVVVFTNSSSASYAEELKPISLLFDYVLPAVEG